MRDSDLALVLQLVRSKADASSLLRRGLTYGQIATLLGDAEERGLIREHGGSFLLTDDGTRWLNLSVDGQGKRRADGGWISPDVASRIDSQAADRLYFPPVDSSFFEK